MGLAVDRCRHKRQQHIPLQLQVITLGYEVGVSYDCRIGAIVGELVRCEQPGRREDFGLSPQPLREEWYNLRTVRLISKAIR
jgi:hypothetical protein